MTEVSNVIAFPRGKLNSPPQSIEEVLENVEYARKEHSEILVDEIMSLVFNLVQDEGISLGDPKCVKSSGLFIESFRAALWKCAGTYHPLHDLADEMFKIKDEDSGEETE